MNPWDSKIAENEFVLGDPESVLILARKHNLIKPKLNLSSSLVIGRYFFKSHKPDSSH